MSDTFHGRSPESLIEEIRELRAALDCYVKAQGRMLDKWAEGDDNVKQGLWRRLHACEDAARQALEPKP